MNIPLQLNELDSLLTNNSDSIIWTQKVSTSKTIAQKMIRYGVLLVFIIILFLLPASDSPPHSSFNFNTIVVIGTYGSFLFYDILKTYLFATLVYSIYPRHITFQSGYFERKSVNIPFDHITAINLVEYNDREYSTIHFGTIDTYDIEKIDFDNYDSRPHITFEKIKNGKEVYELLNYLQKFSRH